MLLAARCKYRMQKSRQKLKNSHLGTIAQLCRDISSQLRQVSTIGKKLGKQQYLLHMSPQYGELRPTSSSDRFVSLGQISTDFASWQHYCRALQYCASAKLCGVEQRVPPIFGRAAIMLGIGPHTSRLILLSFVITCCCQCYNSYLMLL